MQRHRPPSQDLMPHSPQSTNSKSIQTPSAFKHVNNPFSQEYFFFDCSKRELVIILKDIILNIITLNVDILKDQGPEHIILEK